MGVVAKALRKGAHRRKRERRPLPGMMLHQDGSRHAGSRASPPLISLSRSMTRRGRSTRAFSSRRKASTFRALKEVFSERGLPMSLYTDRGSHYFRTTKAGEIDRGCPTQVSRALAQLGVEPIGAFSPQARGRSGRCRIVWSRSSGSPTSPTSRRPTLSSATSICRSTTPTLPLSRPVRARPSRRSRASISTRSCASRRSARSAMTIASPTGRSSCRSRKARCGPHFVRTRVKVHVYPDGSPAVFHGPRCIGRYDEKGSPAETRAA